MQNIQTLKGFRDFLPKETRKRNYVLEILKKVFDSYGFEPLETPALEYEEILTGKYGDEGDKLMYKFKDNGDRSVAMRYDQTVPLARVVAQYSNDLPMPFKRYQIQNVWRAENTQKGRYREFLQVDADIVGSYSPLSDAEIISIVSNCLDKLGFRDFKVLLNDRNLIDEMLIATNFELSKSEISIVFRILDKIKKIGIESAKQELKSNGFTENKVDQIFANAENIIPNSRIKETISTLEKMGIDQEKIKFESTLIRGLDYYTGLIFEVEIPGFDAGSIAGGGRYDNLIGMFLPAGRQVPSVGFAFGFDRLIEAMESLDLFPKNLKTNDVLVAFANSDLQEKAIQISQKLREININAEIYLDDVALEKQLKYANKKQTPFVLILNNDKWELKNMTSGEQKEVSLETLPDELR